MPKYTELTIVKFTRRISFYYFIHAKILMIPCKYLDCGSAGMVVQNKVF